MRVSERNSIALYIVAMPFLGLSLAAQIMLALQDDPRTDEDQLALAAAMLAGGIAFRFISVRTAHLLAARQRVIASAAAFFTAFAIIYI